MYRNNKEKVIGFGNFDNFYEEDKKEKSKRKIYVVGGSLNYARWMQGTIVNTPEDADLLLFTGGEDINPALYDEKPGKFTSFSNRDKGEVEIFNAYPDKKKIGICRGAQLFTALSGGKLIQHVEHHTGNNHGLYVGYIPKSSDFGTTFDTTTCHHQICYPFDMPKDEYVIIAHAEPQVSTTFLDGNNEEIDLHPDFVEPEFFFYPKTNCLCIQGHPEFGGMPDETIDYLRDLLDEFMDESLYDKCKISSNAEINEEV